MRQRDRAIIATAIAATVTAIVIAIVIRRNDKKDEYSYHFGFPTWGGVNNWHWRNPFLSRYYAPGYYHTSVRPYLARRCYSSSETDTCVPGYVKVGKDLDNDGDKDTWTCCRLERPIRRYRLWW